MAEGTKKRFRDVRQEAMQACKDELKDLDVRRRSERDLQTILDQLAQKLEKLVMAKQKEITNQ